MSVAPTAGEAQRVDFDPVTRVAGALAFRTAVDLEGGRVLEASALATMFRGYEVLLEGRDPRDAIFVSSRACGVCGGVHATASALACEMAFGIQPPPAGIVARNLLVAIEHLYDRPTHLFTRVGPDFSEPVVRETNPELWERAQRTAAPGRGTHGFELISDLMTAMTRFSGKLYIEALGMARRAREAYVPLGGKYPHPQTIVPGGVSATIDTQDMNETLLRVTEFFDYAQKVVAVWDDVVDFLFEAEPRFREVGQGPANFIDLGQWDDPYAYDGTFQTASGWAERRWATPGAIVEGRLRTTDVQQINRGVEEFVDHSFYEDWVSRGGGPGSGGDPAGSPLSAHHPANKQTIPLPRETDPRGKYSWSTAARWERHPMETGAYARLWTTALAHKLPHRSFVEPTGHSLRLAMPQGALPATELEWRAPERWGALERNRAQAYALAHAALVAYESLVMGLDLLRKGGPDAGVSTSYKIPKQGEGTGLWGGARGYVSHHMAIEGQVIQRYQIVAPSTFTMSPRDGSGGPGPCEAAVVATPLLSTAARERCIDVLRTIRSFDPCMACATH